MTNTAATTTHRYSPDMDAWKGYRPCQVCGEHREQHTESWPVEADCEVRSAGAYSVRQWCKTHETYVERDSHEMR